MLYTLKLFYTSTLGVLWIWGPFQNTTGPWGKKLKLGQLSVCWCSLTAAPRAGSTSPTPIPTPLLSTCLPYWARVECGKSSRAEFLTQLQVSYILPSICHLFIEKEADEKEDFLKTRKRKCGVPSIHVRLLTHPAPL